MKLKFSSKNLVTLVLGMAVVALTFVSLNSGNRAPKIKYSDHLDMVVAQVDGKDITLLDMAYYVAAEEKAVEEQAVIYSPDNPRAYWDKRNSGLYIRKIARDSAMNKAIHDQIFYAMALEAGVSLTEEEKTYLTNAQEDFWNDLVDIDGQTDLGISQEQLFASMEKEVMAYKYQQIYAEMNGENVERYDFSEDLYEDLLENHEFEVHTKAWKSVDIGNVTIDRE